MLIGWYRKLRMIFDPFLNALYATPRIAMIPLIIIWFGIDWQSKVFIVYMSSFFPILVNTVAGVRSLDPDLLRAARAFCASDWQIFKTIAIPGSVPFILTGIRQGVALGLIGVVVGEMFGGSKGVGFLVGLRRTNLSDRHRLRRRHPHCRIGHASDLSYTASRTEILTLAAGAINALKPSIGATFVKLSYFRSLTSLYFRISSFVSK